MSRAPHLLHIFSTFVPAGPEVRTVRMMNAMGAEYRHSVLAMDGRTEAREMLDQGLDVRVLDAPPLAGSLATVRNLRRILKHENPDLLLSYNWGSFDSVIASRSLRRSRSHIHHEDGFNADEAHGFVPRRVWARRMLLPGVARVVVPSNKLAGIAADTWRLKPEQIALVPNGIDLAQFADTGSTAGELRREAGIPEGALVVGFVGHLRPVKQPVRLVRSLFKAHSDAHLLVLGEGQEREAILTAARELGVLERVHLVGHQRETAAWYRAMDLFALTSDSEQMPVAMLEAMASGLPIVATDVGDVRYMLPEEQSPFVVSLEGGDALESLSRAFEALLMSPELRSELGEANHARATERYAFETMLARYRELYAAACRRTHS